MLKVDQIVSSYSPSVVSLFVGCGGLDLGFKQEGFNLIYSCDNDPAAIDVYKRNVDERAYVRDVTSEEFHNDIKDIGSCDVVLGGFPCQGFSKAGPKRENDTRNLLYLEMKSAIDVLRPRIFIAENVDGLSQNFKGKFFEQIISDFEEIGYSVEARILSAVNYGVAQYRRRIFFVGIREDQNHIDFEWPLETHCSVDRNGESISSKTADFLDSITIKHKSNALTIKDAIYDLRELSSNIPDHRVTKKWSSDAEKIMAHIREGQKLCNVRFSSSSVYTWNIPEVFGDVDDIDIQILETIGKNRRHKKYGNIPNGNPLSEETIKELSGFGGIKRRLTRLVKAEYLKEKNGGYDLKGAMFCSGLFKRPRWDEPSPTVLTNFHNPRYFIHPSRNTPFSLRECARLQGFPDSFIFTQTESVKELEIGYRLVGNAVAPPLSKKMAEATRKIFNQETVNNEITCKEDKPVGAVSRV
ncbi:DNA cytosine methyltransferase [Hahella ganghwensis]|uniref:DNA cytosine methyltransferase n=1 Tax=Hahella ganghwensis TaxID=286420 RepID=UPI0003652687|nr:DNA cytosine methyltransferase [Hahella ganghwensis]